MYDDRSSDAMEPLCFAILKSLTPADIDVSLYDERLEEIPLDLDSDLVAMTVETYTARRAYQIASEYRRRGVPVVLGRKGIEQVIELPLNEEELAGFQGSIEIIRAELVLDG